MATSASSPDRENGVPTYDTSAPRHLLLDELAELYAYRDLLRNLVRKNVTARYKRSILGVGWTLLDPLLMMLVMALVFTSLFARSIPSFPLFLLTGLVIWNFISQASSQAMTDLLYSGSLIQRVYMPRSIFAVTAVGAGLVNLMISLIPLFFLVLVFSVPLTPAILFLPVSVAIVTAFVMGFGLLMSAVAVFYADMVNIHRFLLRLLLYLSGIFYTLEMLPEWLRPLVTLVPTYHMVVIFRDPIYSGQLPPTSSLAIAAIWALLSLLAGFWVFMKLSDQYSYRV